MSGIEAACRESGFTLLVSTPITSLTRSCTILDLLCSYQVEGIVVNAVGMREDGLNRLQQSALPMVLIDRKSLISPAMWSGFDNAQAATTATEHSAEKGFEAILFLQRTAGLGQHPPRAPERLSRHCSPAAPRRGGRKRRSCSSTTAR